MKGVVGRPISGPGGALDRRGRRARPARGGPEPGPRAGARHGLGEAEGRRGLALLPPVRRRRGDDREPGLRPAGHEATLSRRKSTSKVRLSMKTRAVRGGLTGDHPAAPDDEEAGGAETDRLHRVARLQHHHVRVAPAFEAVAVKAERPRAAVGDRGKASSARGPRPGPPPARGGARRRRSGSGWRASPGRPPIGRTGWPAPRPPRR